METCLTAAIMKCVYPLNSTYFAADIVLRSDETESTVKSIINITKIVCERIRHYDYNC